MSFDSHLPLPLLCKLYKDVLYDTNTAKNSGTAFSKSYLGSNKKQITILVKYEDVQIIPAGQLKFLLDILSACKLTLEDVAIVNNSDNQFANFEEIVSEFSSTIVLAFAINPQDLMLTPDLPLLSINRINNHQLLFAPALDQIEIDLPLKKQFWAVLRKLFEV